MARAMTSALRGVPSWSRSTVDETIVTSRSNAVAIFLQPLFFTKEPRDPGVPCQSSAWSSFGSSDWYSPNDCTSSVAPSGRMTSERRSRRAGRVLGAADCGCSGVMSSAVASTTSVSVLIGAPPGEACP
jgi:hypothetical protein